MIFEQHAAVLFEFKFVIRRNRMLEKYEIKVLWFNIFFFILLIRSETSNDVVPICACLIAQSIFSIVKPSSMSKLGFYQNRKLIDT